MHNSPRIAAHQDFAVQRAGNPFGIVGFALRDAGQTSRIRRAEWKENASGRLLKNNAMKDVNSIKETLPSVNIRQR